MLCSASALEGGEDEKALRGAPVGGRRPGLGRSSSAGCECGEAGVL